MGHTVFFFFWVTWLKQVGRAFFRDMKPQPMAMEKEANWSDNSRYHRLSVQYDCKGELRYCIYFQQLCFSLHSVGCVGLRVSMVVGIAHCDSAHCQKVKNLICGDIPWLCGSVYLYWWEIYTVTCSYKAFGVWQVSLCAMVGINRSTEKKPNTHLNRHRKIWYTVFHNKSYDSWNEMTCLH